MTVVDYLKNRSYLMLIIILLIITSIVGAIYIIDLKSSPTTLSEYNDLKQATEKISKIDNVSKNRNFSVFLKKLVSLDNSKLSKDDQLKVLKSAWTDLFSAYSETNEPKLYELSKEFKKFIDSNYTEEEFKIILQCLDPTCSESSSIPQEIQAIIDEIENSTLSEGIKNDYTQQLKTFTFINDDQANVKVIDFLSLAESARNDDELEKIGLNLKIYNDLREYLKKTYPDLYNENSGKIKIGPIE